MLPTVRNNASLSPEGKPLAAPLLHHCCTHTTAAPPYFIGAAVLAVVSRGTHETATNDVFVSVDAAEMGLKITRRRGVGRGGTHANTPLKKRPLFS